MAIPVHKTKEPIPVCWERSKEYPNVIIVNKWRDRKMAEDKQAEKDQAVIDKLNPPWRKALLIVHTALTDVGDFIWTPVTWVSEQLNGTADCRAALRRMEEEEKKNKTV